VKNRATLFIPLLFATQTPARAQHTVAAALTRIRFDARVSVEVSGGDRLEGQLRSVTADSLLLAVPSGQRWVALDEIAELQERGRATRMGAVAGAVAGGVAGAGMVTLVCAIGRADDGVIGNEDQWADCAAVGGALGGAGGAAIGAGIGSLIPKWHVRYRSRP
jgi:hypothetical protein